MEIERRVGARAARVPVEAITTLILGGLVFAVLGVFFAMGRLPLPHI
jgi:hypothetical protein